MNLHFHFSNVVISLHSLNGHVCILFTRVHIHIILYTHGFIFIGIIMHLYFLISSFSSSLDQDKGSKLGSEGSLFWRYFYFSPICWSSLVLSFIPARSFVARPPSSTTSLLSFSEGDLGVTRKTQKPHNRVKVFTKYTFKKSKQVP